jgi:hypothetical protein
MGCLGTAFKGISFTVLDLLAYFGILEVKKNTLLYFPIFRKTDQK